MRSRSIRLAVAVLALVLAVVAVRLWTTRDGGTRAPVLISTAGEDNDLPARIDVRRSGSRRLEIRPEWASWSGPAGRSGLRLGLTVGDRPDVDLVAWWAPGQPAWAVDPRVRGGRDVAVETLGPSASSVRPRGWVVTWSGGPALERNTELLLLAAQTPAATPWRGSFGSSASIRTALGVCDDEGAGCGAIPDLPPR